MLIINDEYLLVQTDEYLYRISLTVHKDYKEILNQNNFLTFCASNKWKSILYVIDKQNQLRKYNMVTKKLGKVMVDNLEIFSGMYYDCALKMYTDSNDKCIFVRSHINKISKVDLQTK